ncbi:MAG: hypothetical protein C4519_22360 [Desulfobacteraceae bacterium]|nr:MAG: hypothetical protein C4519_22360 [Desulfobacteraceae bacterium]
MLRLFFSGWFLVVFLAAAIQTAAGAISLDKVPPELIPWQSWVLHGREEAMCPSHYNDGAVVRCQWPSRIKLEVNDSGGEFDQRWLSFADGWAALPGSQSQWPESVVVDGQSAAVVLRGNAPAVRLSAGEHRIQGRFSWGRKPELIHVPPALGLVALVIEGRPIGFPLIDDQGRLWLQEGQSLEGGTEAVKGRIFRLLDDGVPMQVHTLLRLDVSGRGREIHLDGVLIPNSTPTAIESLLPARIQSDGRLIVQARAGRWEIALAARLSGPQHKISASGAPFGEEIWSFQSRPALRMVDILEVPPVDPGQTEMPTAWRGFPAFLVKRDGAMILKELRRGDPDPAPDQLSLQRTWWLDFNGGGFTVHDQITGTMNRQWHLAMNPPMLLGRVVADGYERVLTEQGPQKRSGVELRRGQLNLQADSRLAERAGVIPAVGWDHDFQLVRGVLNLPPGWRLLAAAGVDQASDTWVQRWSLLDFFLVLIIAMAVYKLRSWLWGVLALTLMILIFQEPGAPRLVWLHLLAALALQPLLPAGWIKRLVGLWGLGAMLVLLLAAVPFAVQQIRWGIYPQLAPSEDFPRPLRGMKFSSSEQAAVAVAPEGVPARRRAAPSKAQRDAAAETVKTPPLDEQDPDALIPTGPGLPDWRWQTIDLHWSGPVAKEQTLTFYLLSPALNLLLALLRVGLLMGLIWSLIDWRPWVERLRRTYGFGPAILLICLGSAMMIVASPAAAQPNAFPPPALLEELRQRLLEKPDCLPHCADISRMEVAAIDDAVQVMLKIHCAERTAVPLPVSRKSWTPGQILMDNAPIGGLTRDDSGQLWALVPSGLHTLVLLGNAGPESVIQMPLPLLPRLAAYSLKGWRIAGIQADGQVGSSIQLTRLQDDKELPADARNNELTPFLQVERVIYLGLSWQTTTTIKRLSPVGVPIMAAVPLLAGESITTPGIDVEGGRALVNMAPDQRELTYAAGLKIAAQILLEAPRAVPWTETWILDAGAVWHCDLAGIPMVHHQDASGQWRPQWQPWPGEQVTIHVHRPKALAGQTKTIDRADLILTPGRRFGQGELALTIRTSRGGQHTIGLPANANLQAVRVNQQSLPVRQDGSFVTVPLQPGVQQIGVQWQQSAPFTAWFKAPPVQIGQPAVSARVTVHMPAQRWILMVGGPRWGPAVLFWSYLVAIVLAAFVLGRPALTPLKTWQWIVLGLGLTQIAAGMALLIVGWLLVLGIRERQVMPRHWLTFNTLQLGLVLWTALALVALFAAVKAGLLGQPDMQIAGNQSTHMVLHWTQDHITENMPQAWVFSLPVWVFRVLMLAWSLWLAWALLGWLKWGWRCINKEGLWRKRVRGGPETNIG